MRGLGRGELRHRRLGRAALLAVLGISRLPRQHAGGVDGFVAKLDTLGCGTWQKGFGDASFQSASGVSADAAGNVLITGSIAGSANLGGTVLTASGDDVLVAKLAP